MGSGRLTFRHLGTFRHMGNYAVARSGSGPRRAGVFAVVALLHALLIGMFARALLRQPALIGAVPLQVRIVTESHRVLRPPPRSLHARPLAAMNRPLPLVVPPLLIRDDAPPAPPRTAARAGPAAARRPAPAPPSTSMQFLSAPADARSYYPFQARLQHQEGSVLTRICVDAGGKIDSVTVLKSSGVYQIDRAALTVGRLTVWKVATVAGKPVADCGALNINFSLSGLMALP
ncbi:MAG TPA: energy transducer TonB [Steroidobacteraceae bacterium]|nr:energy transducer TonB [Steroidobacteraceae bacterium]